MDYEEIKNYWEGRAAGDDSVQSTTQDVFLRQIELNALIQKIQIYDPLTIADVGSGDGRTTVGLSKVFSDKKFQGFDYSESMVNNSLKVIKEQKVTNVEFGQFDIMDSVGKNFDLIYTTRCLINLPGWEMQKKAIKNIWDALADNGVYLMIENFVEGQNNFNRIRSQYGLPAIPIREHNCFFEQEKLFEYTDGLFDVEEELNISSNYYLVSRVIYSKICSDTGQEPNYFDDHHKYAATLPFCGEYGPVRLIIFKKKVSK